MKFEHFTDRLCLQVLPPSYAGAVLEFYKRNHAFLLNFEPEKNKDFYTESFQRSNLISEYNAAVKSQYLRLWLMERQNPGQLIGSICFSNFQRGPFMKCSLGYKLDKDFCHKGYATEALHYAIQLIFEEYEIHRIEALIQPENLPSIRLLEKLHFQKEGYVKHAARINGKWKDHLLYALINENFPDS